MRVTTALALLLMICGCVSQAPLCNSPYIPSGGECCLDENQDRVCDRDKPIVTSTTETTMTTTSTTSTTTTSSTATTQPKPKILTGAILDVQRPDGLVSEVKLLLNSPERAVVGELYIYAIDNDGLNIIIWNTTARLEYDNATGKAYGPPDYNRVSPLKLTGLTGHNVGDSATLGTARYMVYSAKQDRLILAEGRILDDITEGNYTSEYNGYKFKLYGLTYEG